MWKFYSTKKFWTKTIIWKNVSQSWIQTTFLLDKNTFILNLLSVQNFSYQRPKKEQFVCKVKTKKKKSKRKQRNWLRLFLHHRQWLAENLADADISAGKGRDTQNTLGELSWAVRHIFLVGKLTKLCFEVVKKEKASKSCGHCVIQQHKRKSPLLFS